MSHRQFFSRVLFCMTILLGSMAPSLGMDVPKSGFNVKNDNNKPSEEEAYSNNQSSESSYIPLKHFSEVLEESTFSAPSSSSTPIPSKYCITFNKGSITEMDQVFATAPIRAKRIVSRLKQENGMKQASYPGTIFWGEPGTGKTTTALSIAYQMQRDANWKPYFFSSGALVKEHRHATAATLERITNEIAQNQVPFIFIVDEVNLLLENTENKNHDTAATAIVLRNFLDSLRNNPHCFFIGTANRIDKLEEPSKSRFEGKCINFPLAIDPVIKVAIFKTKLTDDRRESSITDADLIVALNPLQNCSGRNLANLADLCEEVFLDRNENSKQIIVGLNHITQAVQEMLQIRIDLKCGQKQETDEERQERHHTAQIAQSVANRTLQTDQFNASQREQLRQYDATRTEQLRQFNAGQTLQTRLNDASISVQAELTIQSIAEQSQHGLNIYECNRIRNRATTAYHRVFPEQRPANYQRLPENAAEEAKLNGTTDSCVLQ